MNNFEIFRNHYHQPNTLLQNSTNGKNNDVGVGGDGSYIPGQGRIPFLRYRHLMYPHHYSTNILSTFVHILFQQFHWNGEREPSL